MDRDREKLALEEKLARCQALAKEFPDGPTAEMIRDIEKEIRDQLRSLKSADLKQEQRLTELIPTSGVPLRELEENSNASSH